MTTLLDLLTAGPQWLVGFPSIGLRTVSHVGEFNGQTWFRWEFSDDGLWYDVMYFDQTPQRMLRYQATVTPEATTTFPNSIVFGPADPAPFDDGTGTTPVVIDYTNGTHCEGSVFYRWTAQRTGEKILLTTTQDIEITTGPCLADPSYYEAWAFEKDGIDTTCGPTWALKKETPTAKSLVKPQVLPSRFTLVHA